MVERYWSLVRCNPRGRLRCCYAPQVYVALCYCKLDYYDVSLEILGVYLNAFQDSAIAVNLKVRGRAAQQTARPYGKGGREQKLNDQKQPNLNLTAEPRMLIVKHDATLEWEYCKG